MFTMYYADCVGNETNCLYPHGIDITDKKSFEQAVSHDYVCAEYKGGYRSNDNFIRSNCLAVEVDNDHSENPEDWVTPADVAKALPNVWIQPSRLSHLRRKGAIYARKTG